MRAKKGENATRFVGQGIVVQTTYMVTIVAAKGAPESNLRIGGHFTPTIDRAIGAAIQKGAARALAHYVRCGKLDKSFRLDP